MYTINNFMMAYSEQDIKKIAELREWLENVIKDKEQEIANLRSMLMLIDNVLKNTSFKPAKELSLEEQEGEVKQLKSREGKLLANAYITKDTITIVPISSLKLSSNIPPFKTFFINRILEGMRSKDRERVNEGKIAKEEVLDYNIEEEDHVIKSIIVRNYRDKARLNEILSASEWVFARMLEKVR